MFSCPLTPGGMSLLLIDAQMLHRLLALSPSVIKSCHLWWLDLSWAPFHGSTSSHLNGGENEGWSIGSNDT